MSNWWDSLLRWFDSGRSVEQLAERLQMPAADLRAVQPSYREFTVPKRTGGRRRLHAPTPELRSLQRRILRRVLAPLQLHPAACGFRKQHSIVTHAARHRGQALVVRCDLRDFFSATRAHRVNRYFRRFGWSRAAAKVLTRICTHDGALPQGAPTSPCLSNLVNWPLDHRLARLADEAGGIYTRYADDLTFSFSDEHALYLTQFLRTVRQITSEFGYEVHRRKKMHVRRRHQRQEVCGLVVNDRPALPRETRRWLRAVEHRTQVHESSAKSVTSADWGRAKRPTLSTEQLEGWRSLQHMIVKQRSGA